MLKFYDVDESYADYLRAVDRQIPYIGYQHNNKFLCGVVFNIDDFNYYAPISSTTQIQRTNLPIYDKCNRVIATIRFSFMFPAPISVLKEKNFRISSKLDRKYTDLLAIEYNYCLNNEDIILRKAQSVYQIGCNKNHKLNYTCCDFKALETAYHEYEAIKDTEDNIAATKDS